MKDSNFFIIRGPRGYSEIQRMLDDSVNFGPGTAYEFIDAPTSAKASVKVHPEVAHAGVLAHCEEAGIHLHHVRVVQIG